jgi:hypothetical protein
MLQPFSFLFLLQGDDKNHIVWEAEGVVNEMRGRSNQLS